LFAWDRRDEQLARAGDVLGADAACEQAVMANAVKAASTKNSQSASADLIFATI
jgi:hypothetical protein